MQCFLKADMSTNAQKPTEKLNRLPSVLHQFPVGRATWWRGIKEGRFPAGIKLSPRVTVWRQSDIDALIQSLTK